MFDISHPFLFFDYFRIPHRLADPPDQIAGGQSGTHDRFGSFGRVRHVSEGGTRFLHWPRSDATDPPLAVPLARHSWDDTPIFGRVLPDTTSAPWLAALGGAWIRAEPIRDEQGRSNASVWREAAGSLYLPFDPAEVIHNFWSERYHSVGTSLLTPLRSFATASYYRIRPYLPRRTQIAIRRRLSVVQARQRFPRWPVETALHDFYRKMFRLTAELASAPVPWLSPWPRGFKWALVLTHDVETSEGYENIYLLRDAEIETGHRSCWNFVPKRYAVEDSVVRELTRDGFEVGVHGLYHDGRDLESLSTLNERLPQIRAFAERWGASGFRAPATHRVWEWMPTLGFDYDSSYPDTDPFEPMPGGCCSLLPFFNQDLVELPITLPQDYTLITVLRRSAEQAWLEKADHIKAEGGMALMISHPDYLLDPELVAMYSRVLREFKRDSSVWHALPREVSSWWRRRADSHIEHTGTGWTVRGPGAEDASIEMFRPGKRDP
jgi:hypothetical protein